MRYAHFSGKEITKRKNGRVKPRFDKDGKRPPSRIGGGRRFFGFYIVKNTKISQKIGKKFIIFAVKT